MATEHYYSSYALVQVSPLRWIVISLSGSTRTGNDPFWTASTHPETAPMPYKQATMALCQFQEAEAKERAARAEKLVEYERDGRSPYASNPGRNFCCPVCLDKEGE